MLKKFDSDKVNGTKNVLFFLSRAPTHHNFTFKVNESRYKQYGVTPHF